MTLPMVEHWYPEFSPVFLIPGSLAFSFVGALHRIPQFPDDIVRSAAHNRDIRQFRVDDASLLDCLSEAKDGCITIIDPASDRMSPDRAEERLSNLRPVVQSARIKGGSVWFLSARPLHCYPALVGSSVLADAESIRVKQLSSDVAICLAMAEGVHESNAARIADFAGGSRALLSAFAQVEASSVSGNEKKRLAVSREREVATRAFAELGADLATLLESWVFEAKMTAVDSDDIPSEAIHSALTTSGLIRRVGGESYALLPFKNRELWIDSLAEWIASVIEPPESWSKVAAELFALERDLRLELSREFERGHGAGWRHVRLRELAPTILELARRDGIPASTSLDELRGPLDWVQLSQLLDLAAEEAGASNFLGLRSVDWERVGRDVLTVRHRIAHMRLVRAGDHEIVRKARRLISIRRSSGL